MDIEILWFSVLSAHFAPIPHHSNELTYVQSFWVKKKKELPHWYCISLTLKEYCAPEEIIDTSFAIVAGSE